MEIIRKLFPEEDADYYKIFMNSGYIELSREEIDEVRRDASKEDGSFKIYGDMGVWEKICVGLTQFYEEIWEQFIVNSKNPGKILKIKQNEER